MTPVSVKMDPVQPVDLRGPFFFVPREGRERLPSRPGTVILDLEDSVTREELPARRKLLVACLSAPPPERVRVLVRCNSAHALDEQERDLDAVAGPHVAGFVLPMVASAAEVVEFDARLTEREAALGLRAGHFEIHVLAECAASFLDLSGLITASPRVASLMFGQEDFLADFPTGTHAAVTLAEARVPLIAAAAGIPSVATPYKATADVRGFARYCARMRALGYHGAFTLHPRQRAIADEVFRATTQELKHAEWMLDAIEEDNLLQLHGVLQGPPMARRARALRSQHESRGLLAPASVDDAGPARVGRFPRYGLDLEGVRHGDTLESPHAYTLDESWRTTWFAHFPTSDAILTSEPAARALGYEARPLPQTLLLNLCLCLSVEPFSQSCRLHLGLRDARALAPVYAGDTMRVRIRVEALRNTSRGDASVIQTTHLMVNQRDEPVYVLTKDSYYAPIRGLEERPARPRGGALHEAFDSALAAPTLARARHGGADTEAALPSTHPLEAGEIILHPAVRPLGWSENLTLSTLVRNTHPLHFDAQRYGRDGLVVCGGFVQAMAQALASPELRQVAEEHVVHSFHCATVKPEDRIGAITRVLRVTPTGDGFEEALVSTLGLLNVDVERDLVGVPIPEAIFGPEPIKPAALRALCARECPALEGRVALRAVRSLRRVAPAADRS